MFLKLLFGPGFGIGLEDYLLPGRNKSRMMKFSGTNFQPWPNFELDISGLTIVIGPSNEGKSSLYRALRGVLRNEIDAAYIRDPKDAPLELTLEDNGYTFKAVRSKKGSVHYVVNHESFDKPKEYAKLDEAIPEEIAKLNMGEIHVGDFTFDPIFAPQNRPQFLIDNKVYKPGEINAILGAFGGTEKLEGGKKQANLLKTQKDGEARVLAAQIRNSEEKKARLEIMTVKAHAIADELHATESLVRQREAETHWLTETVHCFHLLEPLQQITKTLVLPDATGIEQIQQIGVYSEEAAFASTFARWTSKPLQAIQTVGESWGNIFALWKQIKALNDAIELASSQLDTGGLAAFETNIAASELNQLLDSIIFFEDTVALRRSLKETAEKLATIDEELSSAQAELIRMQKSVNDAVLEAERARAEELTEQGLCPRCGKAMEHVCA